MQSCFGILLLIIAAILLMVSLLRWFEQTTEAVDAKQWQRLMLLILAPVSVWLYPSQISAGRPGTLPKHEPVRGFGALPKGGIQEPGEEVLAPSRPPTDAPPPGTPKEFLGVPPIPPKKPGKAVDPDKLAKLRQKMKDQGMLPDE